MKIGFDLDGTLDRPALRELCLALLNAEHEVHIITGIFDEAGDWQSESAKRHKLGLLGIPFTEGKEPTPDNTAFLHMLHAMDKSYGTEYRLVDLGLRKGALSQRLGLDLFFDDSELYIERMKSYDGNVTRLYVK